jgi:hypothetical protein
MHHRLLHDALQIEEVRAIVIEVEPELDEPGEDEEFYVAQLMVRRGSVMVRCGSVMVRRGSVMVRRGSVGSTSACCKASPSLILGSAPQGGISPLSREAMRKWRETSANGD